MRTTNILFLASFFVLTGCLKEPAACFNIEAKATYTVLEPISFTNCSAGAYRYAWGFSDGQIFETEHVEFVPQDTGSYWVVLFADARNRLKSDAQSKTFRVDP